MHLTCSSDDFSPCADLFAAHSSGAIGDVAAVSHDWKQAVYYGEIVSPKQQFQAE